MDDQDAVNFVMDRFRDDDDTTDRDQIAQYLVQEALRRGSTDNITVSVAWLG
jgi:serine/threonine protein phosphatase PrpC